MYKLQTDIIFNITVDIINFDNCNHASNASFTGTESMEPTVQKMEKESW